MYRLIKSYFVMLKIRTASIRLCFIAFLLSTFIAKSQDLETLHRIHKSSSNEIEKVDLLIKIANYHKSKNLDSVEYYCNKTFELSRRNNYTKGEYNAHVLNSYIAKKNKNEILFFNEIDKARLIAEKMSNNILEGETYLKLGTYFYQANKLKPALNNYLKAEQLFNNTDSLFQKKIENLYSIAHTYIRHESYENALLYLNKVIKYPNDSDFILIKGYAYSSLGIIYSDQKNHKEALNNFNFAEDVILTIDNAEDLKIIQHNKAIAYYNMGKYEVAKNTFLKTNNIGTKITKKCLYTESNLYLAKIAIKAKDFIQANLYLKAIKETKIASLQPKILLELANLYVLTKEYDKAIKHCKRVVYYANKNKMPSEKREALLLLSKVYGQQEDLKKENEYFKEYIKIKDSIIAVNNSFNVASLKAMFEHEKLNNELKNKKNIIKALEEKDKTKTSNNILLMICTLLLLSFSVISYFRYKKISKIRNKKLEADKKIKEIQQQQITNFAIHISEKNDLLKKIEGKIKDNNSDESNNSELLFFINNNINENIEKVQLHKDVNSMNDSFHNTLSTKYPILTDKEKRIATLIRLNHSTKQISLQLNIAQSSVNNYRYSLRKKFNITREQNLTEFIKKL